MKDAPEVGSLETVKFVKNPLQFFSLELVSAKLGNCHWLFKIKRKELIYNITEAESEDFIWLRKRKTSKNLEFWSIDQFWEFGESSCGGKVEILDFWY